MYYVNHIGISLLLLAVPAALLAGGENPLAPAKGYWETITAFPSDHPNWTVGGAVAATALAVYVAHNYSDWARKKVTGPALNLGRNLANGDTEIWVITGPTGAVPGADYQLDVLGELDITTPKASAAADEAVGSLTEATKRLEQTQSQILQLFLQGQLEQGTLKEAAQQLKQVLQQIHSQLHVLEREDQRITRQLMNKLLQREKVWQLFKIRIQERDQNLVQRIERQFQELDHSLLQRLRKRWF